MKKTLQFMLFSFAFITLLTACSIPQNISLKDIEKNIIGQTIDDGATSWTFEENDPTEISIVETYFDDRKATIIIDINTQRASEKMSGQLRLHYDYAYMAGDWKLFNIENLTFKQS